MTLRPSGVAALFCLGLSGGAVVAQQPFLSEQHWTLLQGEASGTVAYENLRRLVRLHRVPATPEFDQAAGVMLGLARDYRLTDVHEEHFPIDGRRHYGLLRSYYAWRVDHATLWQRRPDPLLLGDWASDPIRLADFSHSARLEAPLIDVGAGTQASDYEGKNVEGKIVLADGNLAAVQRLAVMRFGAAGIVSDMPNQTTAWSGLDQSLVRWGHLDASLPRGFAFMLSHAAAQSLRTELATGQTVLLDADLEAEIGPGQWTIVTGTIPGTDPSQNEVVFSCHLDHQRPGANDNGSGCVTILEVARLLNRLIESGRLPRPLRTLRFIWGPEIDGTVAYLTAHPDLLRRMRADIHMDMVGGDLFKNKSVLHVTETPWSLPSFVTDVGASFADRIRAGAGRYTEDGSGGDDAVLEDRAGGEGTRNGFFADRTAFTEGSDEDDYDAFGVPSLYLRDWPDITIHTDHDRLDQIDPTKLRRVALLGAAAGYSLASLTADQAPAWLPYLAAQGAARLAESFTHAQALALDQALIPPVAWYESRNVIAQTLRRETAELASLVDYVGAGNPADQTIILESLTQQAATLDAWLDALATSRGVTAAQPAAPWAADPDANRVPHRVAGPGRLLYQNDDVLLDRLGRERLDQVQLLSGAQGRLFHVGEKSALYAFEIVNFVDGKRSVAAIRDAVSAEFGPIPLALVADYLKACEQAKIVSLTP